jgi:RNA 2',3'-cyclic 3'-phosphodiesterase
LRLRVFAALELSPELQQKLAQLQDGFEAVLPPQSVRWVRTEGIHLTLKFYGDVEAERLPELQAGLGRAARAAAPMRLAVEGLGVFPNASRPTVIWAGVNGELEPLRRLQAAVEQEALALGFKPEERDYNPHLTLGRVNFGVRPPDVGRLIDVLAQSSAKHFGDFMPEQLSLMSSELRAGGSVYTQLYAAPLALV